MKILITCPPMIGLINEFKPIFDSISFEVYCPTFHQTMSEYELIELVPQFDGWIIGDDPATYAVFEAGKLGKLKAAVKWGVGVDNVDFRAAKEIGIPVKNTPGMFGKEVADIAMGYIISLARQTHYIDRFVRQGFWPKPPGISLAGKIVALVGFGDIGRNTFKRLLAAEMNVIVYDPNLEEVNESVELAKWPNRIKEADFIVLTCSLTTENRHLIDEKILRQVKHGVRIVNVARGQLINEIHLLEALDSGIVHSAALEVFELEPLSEYSELRNYDQCIFGSHNGSNTIDAVKKASLMSIEILSEFLKIKL